MRRMLLLAAVAAAFLQAPVRGEEIPSVDARVPVTELPPPDPAPRTRPGQASDPSQGPRLPIVLGWRARTGAPGQDLPFDQTQAASESLVRRVLLERTDEDDGRRILAVRWRVVPDPESPVPTALFGEDIYPGGVVLLGPGRRSAEIAVRSFPTGRPSRPAAFAVVLTDAETGAPVLSPYLVPVEVRFAVAGDLPEGAAAEEGGGQGEVRPAVADQKR